MLNRLSIALMCVFLAGWSQAGDYLPTPQNPFLADSPYSIAHFNSAQAKNTLVEGFGDLQRPLQPDETSWRPTEINTYNIRYSGQYPDGRRVAWTGGNRTLFKFDADTMELLARKQITPGKARSAEEVVAYVDGLDELSGRELLEVGVEGFVQEAAGIMTGYYNFVSHNGEQYIGYNDLHNKTIHLKVYGDAIEGDASSDIVLKREMTFPDISISEALFMGAFMTYDGHVIVAMTNGTLYALNRDLQIMDKTRLPRMSDSSKTQDGGRGEGSVTSFLRNAPAIDEQGGIYLVTYDYMQRVQWLGDRFSQKTQDGAWKARYDSGLTGSGTTPNLMGWGDEDKFVITGSGAGQQFIAFWRDEIPNDWQGLPKQDRRVAAVVPIDFGEFTRSEIISEIAYAVKGNGIFILNEIAEKEIDKETGYQSSSTGKFFVATYGIGQAPEFTPQGGVKMVWNSKTRTFEHGWFSPLNFATNTVIDGSDVMYSIGDRGGVWTLQGTDWHTGEPLFAYALGKSQRFNPVGANVEIAPNGSVDCACAGGSGYVRIQPFDDAEPSAKP